MKLPIDIDALLRGETVEWERLEFLPATQIDVVWFRRGPCWERAQNISLCFLLGYITITKVILDNLRTINAKSKARNAENEWI